MFLHLSDSVHGGGGNAWQAGVCGVGSMCAGGGGMGDRGCVLWQDMWQGGAAW